MSNSKNSNNKAIRGTNWHPEEDSALCHSWLRVAQDPTTGDLQKGKPLWEKISEDYKAHHIEMFPSRSIVSLTSRWNVINSKVKRFCGFVAQVESQNKSGSDNLTKLEEARRMYRSHMKESFNLPHCYAILYKSPQWVSVTIDKKGKGKGKATSSSVASSPPQQVAESSEATSLPVSTAGEDDSASRPLERKKSKEVAHNKRRLDDAMDGLEKRQKQGREDIVKFFQAQETFKLFQLQETANRLKEEEIEIRRQEADSAFFQMDMATITDPASREYFKICRQYAMERLEVRRLQTKLLRKRLVSEAEAPLIIEEIDDETDEVNLSDNEDGLASQ